MFTFKTIFTYEAFIRLGGLSSQHTTEHIERGLGMFERLTDRARTSIVFAQQEAKELRHNYIGTEHLLLGLIHEGEGVAAQVLLRLGFNLDDIREMVREAEPPARVITGHMPFTIRAKQVLERAAYEARQLEVPHIGTEHILLGLLLEGPREREDESTAWKIFEARGLDREKARRVVLVDFLGYELTDEN